jgi:hypothetical protein
MVDSNGNLVGVQSPRVSAAVLGLDRAATSPRSNRPEGQVRGPAPPDERTENARQGQPTRRSPDRRLMPCPHRRERLAS